jgi:hypothetical protein
VKFQLLILTLLLGFPAGCGKPPADAPSVPIHPVSGIVTLDGKPIEGARLALISLQGQQPGDITPNGISDAEGKFQISTYSVADGAPDGAYAITVANRSTSRSTASPCKARPRCCTLCRPRCCTLCRPCD